MSDRIVLTGVRGRGRHGVFEHERRDGQEFVVDVVLELDLRRAGRSDALDQTVNYAEVAQAVHTRIVGEPCFLVERLAELVATDLLARPGVEAVEVVVHKPQAPIGLPVGDVAVAVRRERGTPVVVALGANLGDRVQTLTAAVEQLADVPGLRIGAASRLFETEPVGGPEQPSYLNAVVIGGYAGSPARLLRALHAIEHQHGRQREIRWGARSLDLDLVQFGTPGTPGERLSEDPALRLPHPRAHERAFVLAPWVDADPTARLRVGSTLESAVLPVAELLSGLPDDGVRPGPGWSPAW